VAQLEIAYFIITFLIGIVSLGFSIFFYFNRKDEVIKSYIYFYSTFTAIVVFNFVSSYLRANIIDYKSTAYYILLYLENPFFFSVMIFALPYFFHLFLSVNNPMKRNIVFAGIAIITFAVHNGLMFLEKQVGSISSLAMFKNIVFILVLIYVWYQTLTAKKLDKTKTQFVRKLSVAFFLVVVVIVNDTFLLDITAVKFFPALYSILGIVFTRYFYRMNFNHSGMEIKNTTIDQEEFSEKYDISKREMEVINLLVEGKSYRQISEELFISLNTVKTHIRNIYPKINVSSRHEIVNLISNNSKIKEDGND